jgi:hypothetical protein
MTTAITSKMAARIASQARFSVPLLCNGQAGRRLFGVVRATDLFGRKITSTSARTHVIGRRKTVGQESTQAEGKPCICHIKKSGWPWKASGEVVAGQREEKCRICGATHLVSA